MKIDENYTINMDLIGTIKHCINNYIIDSMELHMNEFVKEIFWLYELDIDYSIINLAIELQVFDELYIEILEQYLIDNILKIVIDKIKNTFLSTFMSNYQLLKNLNVELSDINVNERKISINIKVTSDEEKEFTNDVIKYFGDNKNYTELLTFYFNVIKQDLMRINKTNYMYDLFKYVDIDEFIYDFFNDEDIDKAIDNIIKQKYVGINPYIYFNLYVRQQQLKEKIDIVKDYLSKNKKEE